MGCDEILDDMLLIRVVFRNEVVNSNMWKKAVDIKEPIYKEWCLEFFSTLTLKKEITDEGVLTDKFMSKARRRRNVSYIISVWENAGDLL